MAEQERAPLEIDLNDAIRGLLDVAKVALGPGAETIPDEEGCELLIRLMAVIERTMPPDLMSQDVRVMRARIALDARKQ